MENDSPDRIPDEPRLTGGLTSEERGETGAHGKDTAIHYRADLGISDALASARLTLPTARLPKSGPSMIEVVPPRGTETRAEGRLISHRPGCRGKRLLRNRLLPLLPGLHLHVKGTRGVALTFDDGPDRETTPMILHVLRDAGVRATFFLIGERVLENPELASRIAEEGHLVGNHSHTHRDPTRLSFSEFRKDYRRCHEAIASVVGYEPRFFRPPSGHVCARAILHWLRGGVDVVLWTVELIHVDDRVPCRRALDGPPGQAWDRGDICLLHGDTPALLNSLPEAIAQAKAKGLEPVRLDETLA